MTGALRDANEILADLQARVAAGDLAALERLFVDPAVLIGTSGDARTAAQRHAYLAAVLTAPEALTWEWRETDVFYESPAALGFAAFGDVMLRSPATEWRAPIRATLFAVRSDSGWRLRHFHGSIAQPEPT